MEAIQAYIYGKAAAIKAGFGAIARWISSGIAAIAAGFGGIADWIGSRIDDGNYYKEIQMFFTFTILFFELWLLVLEEDTGWYIWLIAAAVLALSIHSFYASLKTYINRGTHMGLYSDLGSYLNPNGWHRPTIKESLLIAFSIIHIVAASSDIMRLFGLNTAHHFSYIAIGCTVADLLGEIREYAHLVHT